MELHSAYGVSLPEKNWIPAPRYLMRRNRILNLLQEITPGSWLEIGCGAGALLFDLSQKGFNCSILEHSSHALTLVDAVRKEYGFALDIYTQPQDIPAELFDCVGAFEVLEHIEDDTAALRQWSQWLCKDGLLLLSVPAHMQKWNASDTWAGHFRRYEKNQLIEMLKNAGLEVEHFECYGFPLANMIDPLRSRIRASEIARDDRKDNNHERDKATAQSGTNRKTETRMYPLLKSLPGRLIMDMAFRIQTLFLNMDLGNGYLVVARKK
jgi:SAM-dependent methyltransferase